MKTETNHSLDLFHFKRLFIESLNFYFSAETRDEINLMENFPFYILTFSNIFLIILILKKINHKKKKHCLSLATSTNLFNSCNNFYFSCLLN